MKKGGNHESNVQINNPTPVRSNINTEVLPQTSEDAKRFLEISVQVQGEIAALTAGIAAIGNIFSDVAHMIQDEETVNIGWLLSNLASTVDGLRYVESQADSLLEKYDKNKDEQPC